MAHVVILGAGVMGSAMAFPASDSGQRVSLVGTHFDRETIESIKGNGHHPRLNVTMPGGVMAYRIDRKSVV